MIEYNECRGGDDSDVLRLGLLYLKVPVLIIQLNSFIEVTGSRNPKEINLYVTVIKSTNIILNRESTNLINISSGYC